MDEEERNPGASRLAVALQVTGWVFLGLSIVNAAIIDIQADNWTSAARGTAVAGSLIGGVILFAGFLFFGYVLDLLVQLELNTRQE